MKTTKKGFGIMFLPPEHLELVRDFILAGKGDRYGIKTYERCVFYALEEFLVNNGYREQIVEMRHAPKPDAKLSLKNLNPEQREAVIILMNERKASEEQAIKWVVEHKDDLRAVLEN